MFTRFNGNVVPFADDATSTNRTVFGGTTQSDLIDDNLNTNFKKGWEIVGLNDNPTREDFNGMGYTLGALTAYLYEMGISEWNASQNYRTNSRVTGSDGKIYKSLTGTTGIPNVGNNPTTDAVNWVAEEAEKSVVYSALTVKTTPVDADLIAIADSTSSFSLKKLSWTNIKATLKTYFDTLYLALTGAQTVDGVKTFSSSPIVPTPTSNTQAANKAYVDSNASSLPIGTILNGYTILDNCIVAFGGEFNRDDYPKLWAYLQANPTLVKTQAQWTTENTTNGMCGFFSDGNGATTFRVPNLDKAFFRASNRGVGTYEADAFKSHTHAIYEGNNQGTGASTSLEGTSASAAATQDTSSAGGSETRPKNIAFLPLIVAK